MTWHDGSVRRIGSVTNPTKLSKRRAQTDNLKSINLHQLS